MGRILGAGVVVIGIVLLISSHIVLGLIVALLGFIPSLPTRLVSEADGGPGSDLTSSGTLVRRQRRSDFDTQS